MFTLESYSYLVKKTCGGDMEVRGWPLSSFAISSEVPPDVDTPTHKHWTALHPLSFPGGSL